MLFERFDEDKNGFIEKSEMAIFLKKVFRNKDS
jgi:Ca2+-binding EF-hand superfamily protein